MLSAEGKFYSQHSAFILQHSPFEFRSGGSLTRGYRSPVPDHPISMPAPHGYIERLAELAASGAPFASVTLVDAVGSTPADVGSKMLVTAAGLDFGTVGG